MFFYWYSLNCVRLFTVFKCIVFRFLNSIKLFYDFKIQNINVYLNTNLLAGKNIKCRFSIHFSGINFNFSVYTIQYSRCIRCDHFGIS